jgi:peptide-methionine (S)-S-oxide reductase
MPMPRLATCFTIGAAALIPVSVLLLASPAGLAGTSVEIAPPAVDETAAAGAATETMVLAGGCFWGTQGVFEHVDGVVSAVAGYAGGARDTARYNRVEEGDTGHAESVEITFDPHRITYGKLLQIFFSVAHDPTELNRQGPDFGPQYRSAIFTQTPEQQKVAAAYIAQLDKSGAFSRPIATKLEPFTGFYPAEAYHQDFLTRHPDYPYIVVNDMPKVRALEKEFQPLYHDKPVLAGAAAG